MSRSTISLALRIALLIEESSEKEIRAAIALLRQYGVKSDLFAFLAQRIDPPSTPLAHEKPPSAFGTPSSLENTTSLAVLQLRDVDQDKYRLLSEFDKMVRRGQVLVTHEDMKRFGEKISKEFQPRKSRKDTIGHLMATMAERPLGEIEKLVELAGSFGIAGDTDEYQRLAQFIIKGKQASP